MICFSDLRIILRPSPTSAIACSAISCTFSQDIENIEFLSGNVLDLFDCISILHCQTVVDTANKHTICLWRNLICLCTIPFYSFQYVVSFQKFRGIQINKTPAYCQNQMLKRYAYFCPFPVENDVTQDDYAQCMRKSSSPNGYSFSTICCSWSGFVMPVSLDRMAPYSANQESVTRFSASLISGTTRS